MKKNVPNYTLDVKRYSLIIGWLYPELMNIYGDRGNIITLVKRCEWRGIKAKVVELNPEFDQKLLATCNLLDIFDLYTENPGPSVPRLIGNIAVQPNFDILRVIPIRSGESRSKFSTSSNNKSVIVGFENHGGRTYLGKKIDPMGKVIKGFGNNGNDQTEGAKYKNSFGTYMHGPVLPKNPHFADYLLKLALERKYPNIELQVLDDTLEWQAHSTIAKRLRIEI